MTCGAKLKQIKNKRTLLSSERISKLFINFI